MSREAVPYEGNLGQFYKSFSVEKNCIDLIFYIWLDKTVCLSPSESRASGGAERDRDG